MKKVCVVTGTRAEYGLLRPVMMGLLNTDGIKLQIIVTGAHLSPEFGLTYRAIQEDGFLIDQKVEMLISSDTPVGITKSMGLGLIGFADALENLKPDLIVVLGDRFEIFAMAAAALHAQIPVIHLHGGEITEGSLDELMRHAITKLSQVHFVATKEYLQRVIQLGEQPGHVHLVGGLGVDLIKKTKLLTKNQLENDLNFKFKDKNFLITFHPVHQGDNSSSEQFCELLKALSSYPDIGLIFTFPSADSGSRELIGMLETFIADNQNAKRYYSLGYQRYLSCMALCDATVGNSSSGLLETPTFKKGTINIGNRQKGRKYADSVIHCSAMQNDIKLAIEKLFSDDFQLVLNTVKNPYGDGGASEKIVEIIRQLNPKELTKKVFYDLSIEETSLGSKK